MSDSTDQEQSEQEFETENESVDYTAETHADTFISESPSANETLSETEDSVNNATLHTEVSKPDCSSFKTPKSISKRIKKFKSATPEHIEKTINTLKSLKEDVQKTQMVDEFSHFANNIASQLRQIPIAYAMECQLEIMKLVQEKRLMVMRRNQQINESSTSCNTFYNPGHNQEFYNIHHSNRSETPELSPRPSTSAQQDESLSNSQDSLSEEYSTGSILSEAIHSIGGFDKYDN